MNFVDNNGHIWSMQSYDYIPIGYEYDETTYVYYIDNNKMSVGTYCCKSLNILLPLSFTTNNPEDNTFDKQYDIEISIDSSIYKLVSSIQIQDMLDSKMSIEEYFEFEQDSEHISKTKLTNDDLYCVKVEEKGITYAIIPVYILGYALEEGTWISQLLVHVVDKITGEEEWCPVSIGSTYYDEVEELTINGNNMGISLPKEILKAIYSESYYNDEFNVVAYDTKLKEYLLNYMSIKGQCGNFNSAINSLKWFGYGEKLSISKLFKTDNEIKSQYIHDYFDISYDLLESFRLFRNTSLINLKIEYYQTGENIPQNMNDDLWGEGNPEVIDLSGMMIKTNYNDTFPESQKTEYWKSWFDFTFDELSLKLSCLAYYYKKYFLPVYLNIHSAYIENKVYAPAIKLSSFQTVSLVEPNICLENDTTDVKIGGNGTHYFFKQLHYVDSNFNEFNIDSIELNKKTSKWYKIHDTCVNIPIKFMKNNTYYKCVLLLTKPFKDIEGLFNFEIIYDNEYKLKHSFTKQNGEISIEYENIDDETLDLIKKEFLKEKTTMSSICDIPMKIENGIAYYRIYGDEEYRIKLSQELFIRLTNLCCRSHSLYDNEQLIYESHFDVFQTDNNSTYLNFIIYPRIMNLDTNNKKYKNLTYWENNDFILRLLVNNTWYTYDFRTKMPTIDIELGKLEYQYWTNENNFLKAKVAQNGDGNHMLLYTFGDKEYSIENTNGICKLSSDKETIFELPEDEAVSRLDAMYDSIKDDDNIDTSIFDNIDHIVLRPDLMSYDYVYKTNNYLSKFTQFSELSTIATQSNPYYIKFNSYMHNVGIATTNNIDFDLDIQKLFDYLIENNIKYIDGSYLKNGDFCSYILYYNTKIYVDNNIIGKDFVLPNELFEDMISGEKDVKNSLLLILYKKGILVLDEMSSNNESTQYEIFGWCDLFEMENDDTWILMEDDPFELQDKNGFEVENNSLEFLYKWKVKTDDLKFKYENGKYRETTITNNLFDIYDYVYSNEYAILDKYVDIANIEASNKYLNNIILYDLNLVYKERKNVLIFPNDIHININGVVINHGTYIHPNYNTLENAFFINGKLDDDIDEVDTRNIDIYDTFNGNVEDLLIEKNNTKYVYYQRKKIVNNEIVDAEGEYCNVPYEYIEEDNFTILGKTIYSSLDNFKANIYEWTDIERFNELVSISTNDSNVKIYTYIGESNGNEIIYELSYNLVRYVKYENGEWVDNEMTNSDYILGNEGAFEIQFKYKKSRFVTYDEIETNLTPFKDEDGNEYIMTEDNVKIPVLKQYQYFTYKNKYDNDVWSQNPGMYIITYDNEQKFAYDMDELEEFWPITGTIDTITETLTKIYGTINVNTNPDTNEQTYSLEYDEKWVNLLVKDLTYDYNGNNLEAGEYVIGFKSSVEDNHIRLCVYVVDNDGNEHIYDHNDDVISIQGNEKTILAYFAIDGNIEYDNDYIIPYLLNIKTKTSPLKYITPEPHTNEQRNLKVKIDNKEYEFGTVSEYDVLMYKDLFRRRFNIYDLWTNNGNINMSNIVSTFDSVIDIEMELDYDMYLMHDFERWFILFISKDTIDKCEKSESLVVPDDKKYINIESQNIIDRTYNLTYVKSENQILVNRLKFMSSNGKNIFSINDIICSYIHNNDSIPVKIGNNSKWNLNKLSIGTNNKSQIVSNNEIAIMSMYNTSIDRMYENSSGYYSLDVSYSLDREIQHKKTNTIKFMIS